MPTLINLPSIKYDSSQFITGNVLEKRGQIMRMARETVHAMRQAEPLDGLCYFTQPFTNCLEHGGNSNDDDKSSYRERTFTSGHKSAKKKTTSKMEEDLEILKMLSKPTRMDDTVNKILSDYNELKTLHSQAIDAFENSMKHNKEIRGKLDDQHKKFDERRHNFRQLIIDNVNKIHRQHKSFTANRYAQILAREAMIDLINDSRQLRSRCEAIEKKIENLKPCEKYLYDVIALLPADYIKKCEDPIRSLMLRYESLQLTRTYLVNEFDTKQKKMDKEIVDLTNRRLDSISDTMLKVAKIHNLTESAEAMRETLHGLNETTERLKDATGEKLRKFITIIRGIRNITRKADTLLTNIQYKRILKRDVDNSTMSECFSLLKFFLSVIFGIKDDLTGTISRFRRRERRSKRI